MTTLMELAMITGNRTVDGVYADDDHDHDRDK